MVYSQITDERSLKIRSRQINSDVFLPIDQLAFILIHRSLLSLFASFANKLYRDKTAPQELSDQDILDLFFTFSFVLSGILGYKYS